MYTILSILAVIAAVLIAEKTVHRRVSPDASVRLRRGTTLVAIVAAIACFLVYAVYDRMGYPHGLESTFSGQQLPYNVEPEFYSRHPQTFYLIDEDGNELAGAGTSVTTFAKKDLFAYGYNDSSILLKCRDSATVFRYLISYETGNQTRKGNPDISFTDLKNDDFERIKSQYQWFLIDFDKARSIMTTKFWAFTGGLLSLLLIIRNLFKIRRAKALR
jgi:hypothetical protein